MLLEMSSNAVTHALPAQMVYMIAWNKIPARSSCQDIWNLHVIVPQKYPRVLHMCSISRLMHHSETKFKCRLCACTASSCIYSRVEAIQATSWPWLHLFLKAHNITTAGQPMQIACSPQASVWDENESEHAGESSADLASRLVRLPPDVEHVILLQKPDNAEVDECRNTQQRVHAAKHDAQQDDDGVIWNLHGQAQTHRQAFIHGGDEHYGGNKQGPSNKRIVRTRVEHPCKMQELRFAQWTSSILPIGPDYHWHPCVTKEMKILQPWRCIAVSHLQQHNLDSGCYMLCRACPNL